MISAALRRTQQTGEPFDIGTDFLTARGDSRRVRTMGELELRRGRQHAIIGVFHDVTDRHVLEQALRRNASTDDLTRLANRARFNDVLDEALALAKGRQSTLALALALIDLDHFKMVNDRCGHIAGDGLLQQVAAKLNAPYLAECFAARLGGDEFVLIVQAPALLADLPGLLRRLLANLRMPIDHASGVIPVSGTIGVAGADGVRDRSALLHCADLALYTAKQAGRGSAAIFGHEGLIVLQD